MKCAKDYKRMNKQNITKFKLDQVYMSATFFSTIPRFLAAATLQILSCTIEIYFIPESCGYVKKEKSHCLDILFVSKMSSMQPQTMSLS